eukprot:SAG11_NODE_4460_length_1887_cov_31.206935_2_plen_421_part_01
MIAKTDLFINGKQLLWEFADRPVYNYSGNLPVVSFNEILKPYINKDKFYVKQATAKLPRTPSEKASAAVPTFKNTEDDELIVYLLSCINPNVERIPHWINVINFMKYSSGMTNAFEITQQWNAGEFWDGPTTTKSRHTPKEFQSGQGWSGVDTDQGYDINVLRRLANNPETGNPQRYKMWGGHIAVKESLKLAEKSKVFHDTDCADLLIKMLPNHVYDANLGNNKSVFKLQESGIWKQVTMAEVKLYVKTSLRPILTDVLRHHKAVWREIAERYIKWEEESGDKPTKKDIHLMKQLQGDPKKETDADGNQQYCDPPEYEVGLWMKTYCGQLNTYIDLLHQTKTINSAWEAFKILIQQSEPKLDHLWNQDDIMEWIFPFDNGVFDLKSYKFRPARADEFVYHTCGRDFKEGKPEVKQRILDE